MAAILFISFTAYKLYEEAIPRLFASESAAVENPWLAVAVLVANLPIIAWPFVRLLWRKDRGAAASAQLTEYVNDLLGISAALVGTLFIIGGIAIADPVASIVVATIIARNGIMLFRENVGFLLGRSPGPEYLARTEAAARAVPGVVDVHEIRAEYVGPDVIHAGLHVGVAPGTPIEERIGSGETSAAGSTKVRTPTPASSRSRRPRRRPSRRRRPEVPTAGNRLFGLFADYEAGVAGHIGSPAVGSTSWLPGTGRGEEPAVHIDGVRTGPTIPPEGSDSPLRARVAQRTLAPVTVGSDELPRPDPSWPRDPPRPGRW